MKIIISREAMFHAFTSACMAVKAQSTKPILRNIKLEARPGEVILLGTDMEIGIRIVLPCEQVEAAGDCVLPSDRFSALLKENTDDTLTIESNEKKTRISTERAEIGFPTQDPADFPSLPIFSADHYFSAPARYVKEAIRRTTFATDVESGRYALAGVYLDYQDSMLNFVATDSRRLANQCISVSVTGEFPESLAVVATPRSLQMLDRLLVANDEEVRFAFLENSFMVQCGNIFFHATLVEGRFPEWRKTLLQIKSPVLVPLPVGPFFAAVRQASIVTSKEAPGLLLSFDSNKLTLHATNTDLGESKVEMPVQYDGEPMEIKMNQYYLQDFLRIIDSETIVTMHIVHQRVAALLTTPDEYQYLIMPMHEEKPRPAAPANP
ncbi:MAG: DNA polymerase III subunit beta [Planctomycetia bacterium]|nr:DNA polymerase III subunit beta [Planctomycetia bacterium]